MSTWTPFPHAGAYAFDVERLKKSWARLHQGDCEPWPSDAAVLNAWVLFHNGEFEKAAETGLKAGGDGITVANKATCIYANYLENSEKNRLELFMKTALRAEAQQAAAPENANAWYWQAYALGRYSQGISVAKALAQGFGNKVKTALEQAIKLSPRHADAHLTLAAFHADVIDKVGCLIGGMTYGVRKDISLMLYREALRLNPGSAIAMTEYAHGLLMLEGDKRLEEASELYEQAAACQPLDAMEQLNVEMVRVELQD
ncbi:MAG: hypothetical protein M3R45_13340 [Pseudomonadota bacterium]|nr:hypothetical protein [Pseudomonadota bacterium]